MYQTTKIKDNDITSATANFQPEFLMRVYKARDRFQNGNCALKQPDTKMNASTKYADCNDNEKRNKEKERNNSPSLETKQQSQHYLSALHENNSTF